jgi:hypothetical protein
LEIKHKEMKNLIILCGFILGGFTSAISQNVYGISGLIQTPSAYTVGDGKAFVSACLYDDHYKTNDQKRNLFWTQSINIGFLSRLELGIRLVSYPDLEGSGHDRNLNFKLVAFKEKKYMPQIAIGIQDATGTCRYNNTYLVLSKTISLNDKFEFCPSMGFGTKLSVDIFGEEAGDYRLQGFFGGTRINYTRYISLMAEYHELGFDCGIQIRPFKWLFLKAFVNNDSYWGGMLGLWFGI